MHACMQYAPVVTVASSHPLRPVCRLIGSIIVIVIHSFVHSFIHPTIFIHTCIHGSTSFLSSPYTRASTLGSPPRPVPQTPGRHTGPFGAADDRGAAVFP